MKRNTKKALVALFTLAVLVGGGVAAYVLLLKAPATATVGATIEVSRGNLVETAAASGTIEPHVQVEVKSRTSGEVIEILVKEGDRVEAGQLLVRLDPTDAERQLAEAKVSLAKARADLTAAQASLSVADLDRKKGEGDETLAKKSAELGLGPEDSVRTSQHGAKVAAANVALRSAQAGASRAQLESAQLAVQDAETRLKETRIFAPIAGTVLEIPIEKGTIVASALTNVSGGTSVATLADLSDLRVVGAIDEAQIGRVRVGQPVSIRVDAYPSQTFRGVVDRVSPLGKTVSSVVTFDVEIVVKDEHADLLRSGMSADVEIVTAELTDVLLVPLTAIQSSGGARFVALPSGERRRIKTGATDGTSMVVLEGLEAGEVILASPTVASPAKSGGASKSGSTNPMRGMGGPMGGPPPGRR